jgi:CheY-like chemotaxis protein
VRSVVALKILLADDSMTAQNMGKKILLDAGYDVVAVSNGAAAMKKIASDRPDIIILDVYMPGYTGLEVCERVKAARETSRTPVLLTVGKMEPFKPEDANRVKADGVMVKPFEASDLIAVVQNFGKPAGAAKTPGSTKISTYIDTVPIPAPQRVHEDTVRLTPDEVRAFQDRDAGAPAGFGDAHTSPAADFPVTAPAIEAVEPSPSKEESAKEMLEPFVASSVLEALSREEELESLLRTARNTPANVAVPGISEFGATIMPNSPAMFQPETEEAPAISADAGAQPFFAVQGSELETASPVELTPSTPIFLESSIAAVKEETPTVQTAESGKLLDLETNGDGPVEILSAAAPELEINSPPELRAEQVSVTPDPALITDHDEMAGFITTFGAANAEEVKVGLVSDLPEDQLAAVTLPPDTPFSHEVTAEIASVLGVQPEPQVLDGSNASAHIFDEIGGPIAEAPVLTTDSLVSYVPGMEETHQFSPVMEQPFHEEGNPTQQVVEMASLTLDSHQLVEPETATVEGMPEVETPVAESDFGPEAAFSAAAAAGSTTAPGFIASEHVPESALVETGDAAKEQPSPEAQIAEQFIAALNESEARQQQAVAEEVAGAPPENTEAKDLGATDLRLSDAVARAFERLKPQIITEILKELKK